MKISIDFDGTLTRNDVQEKVKHLMLDGHEIYVVTSRFDDLHKHLFPTHATNEDLWQLIDELMIKKHHVFFMNMVDKSNFLDESAIKIHVDNDEVEIESLKFTSVKAVDVKCYDWKDQLDEILMSIITV